MRFKMASVSCMCASSGSCQYVDLFPPPSVRVDMVEKKLGSDQVLWRGKGSMCAVGIFIWFGQNFLTRVSSSLELASLVLRKGNTRWTVKSRMTGATLFIRRLSSVICTSWPGSCGTNLLRTAHQREQSTINVCFVALLLSRGKTRPKCKSLDLI